MSFHFNRTTVLLYRWVVICLFILEGRVVTAEPGFIYEPPSTIRIKEGSSVSMACLLNKEAGSFKVVWTKDSNYLDIQNRFSVSIANRRQYTLRIDPVQREDEGIYKCVGNKENGTLYDAIFTSGSQLVVIKTPGPRYPQVSLSRSRYDVGEEIVAYCISERVHHPPNITWFNSPDEGLINQFHNSSYVGVTIRFEASEEINQTTLLCKMIVDGVAVPRFKRTMPIFVNPILPELVDNVESASTCADVLTTPNNSDGTEYMSLIIIFACLYMLAILRK